MIQRRSSTALGVLVSVLAASLILVCGFGFAASDARAPNFARLQDAGLLAAWKDGEIRQTYDPGTNRTQIFLAWVLSCPQATPTLTFSAAFKGKQPKEPPGSLSVRVGLGAQYNPNVARTLTLVFVVDDDTKIDVSRSLIPPALAAGANVDNAVGTLDLTDFSRLVSARIVTADVFGETCSVTKSQVDRLYSFAELVLPHRSQYVLTAGEH